MAALWETHVAPLNSLVHEIRRAQGAGYEVPYFDPADGGVDAKCLFLLEAPGPRAVKTGFVSRNNPDPTAKRFFELNHRAGLPRCSTVSWNVVPWYIGSGVKIRPAYAADIKEAMPYLAHLLELLPHIVVTILIGRKAQRARDVVKNARPHATILDMPHPGPRVYNADPASRRAMLRTLRKAARLIERP